MAIAVADLFQAYQTHKYHKRSHIIFCFYFCNTHTLKKHQFVAMVKMH